MKCYRCKKSNLKSAVRVMMPAKNSREKDAFRNICDDCYPIIMEEKGYKYVNGIWRSANSRPTTVCAGLVEAGQMKMSLEIK